MYTLLSIALPTIGIICCIIWQMKNPVVIPVQTTIHEHTAIIKDCIYSCNEYQQIMICEDMIKERIDPKDPHYKDCIRVLNQCLMIQKAKLGCKSQERVIKQLASQIKYFKTYS